jgi:hypothetical protein
LINAETGSCLSVFNAELLQQANQKTDQGNQKEDDQDYGHPFEQSGFGLGEFVAADGTALVLSGYFRGAVGAFLFAVSRQASYLADFYNTKRTTSLRSIGFTSSEL